ncbi:MAG: hypothetical protein KME08_17110 [Aphanothece sp. CMT-3BRIN-NPC111]|jgi:nitrate/nitrite-specific signal transduction histidine kinase|nr:hypothetical protein [Aphanothece sp. CMT-3BRIN-NPC111]
MIDTLVFCLEWLLRAFGAFWVIGGAFTLQQARQASFIDSAIEAITQEKENRLVSRFLFMSALLTLLSGIGLALASRWVLLPLALLIVSQGVYFAIQRQQFTQAKTDEERDEARIASSTRNAFIVSLVVAIAALVGERVGALR